MPKFHNKQGLTPYSFACGYMQVIHETCDGVDYTVELYLDGAVYATRVFIDGERREWVCEENLSDARKHWDKFVVQYLPWLVRWHKELPKAGRVVCDVDTSDKLGHWVCCGWRDASKWEAVATAWRYRNKYNVEDLL